MGVVHQKGEGVGGRSALLASRREMILVPSQKPYFEVNITTKPFAMPRACDKGAQGSDTIEFDSYMIPTSDLNNGDLRLLEVDNRIIVPIQTQVRVLVTAADVLHFARKLLKTLIWQHKRINSLQTHVHQCTKTLTTEK